MIIGTIFHECVEIRVQNASPIRRVLIELAKEKLEEVKDEEKKKAAILFNTKNDSRGYAGVDDVEKVSSAAIPVLYSKLKTAYQKRTGKAFEYKTTEDNSNAD